MFNYTIKVLERHDKTFHLLIIDTLNKGTHDTYNVVYNNDCNKEVLNNMEEVKQKISEKIL